MALRADIENGTEFTLALLEAIGTAWSTFLLYPDPTDQPAFVRAVEALSDQLQPALVVAVGPGTFLQGEEEYDIRRDGTERLARELFLHDVEYMRLTGGTSAPDLVTFFETLDLDDERVRELGGISALMGEQGDLGIEVFERGLLVITEVEGETDEDTDPVLAALLQDVEGLSEAAAAATRGADPDEVAAILERAQPSEAKDSQSETVGDTSGAESSAGALVEDPTVAAFLSGLSELHERALPYAETAGRVTGALKEGASDPWKGFRTFLEAFFHLPRPAQLVVLEAILEEGDSVARQLFLDQLSGADLNDYVPDLTDGGREALAAYAVIVGSEAGRPGEVIGDAVSSRDVSSARQAVAARISEVLQTGADDREGAEELIAALHTSMSTGIDDFQLGTQVLRGLLQAEERDERFSRVLRVWTGRVSRHLRDGEWKTGHELLDAVLRDPPYTAEREDDVRSALERVAGRETLRLILDGEFGAQPSEDAMQLIETMGAAAVGPLVEMLAREEDAQARRLLTELLAQAARPNPRSIDHHLPGQPWFLLRNLATVLAKTGRREAVAPLLKLLNHDDYRVRVEALRGLVRIQRDESAQVLVKMLDDPHERVRHNAATLARSAESSQLDGLLAHALLEDRLRPDVAVSVVHVLAGRGSPEARGVVEDLARQRFKVKGASRAVRDAAREALGGRIR